MPIESFRQGKVLLTGKESDCFRVARQWQRRTIIRRLKPRGISRLMSLYTGIKWSPHPILRVGQMLLVVMVSIILLPLMLAWGILKKLYLIVILPFSLILSFRTPVKLSAPGEKTLAGMHNGYSPYLDLGLIETIGCLNDWAKILFGETNDHVPLLADELQQIFLQCRQAGARNDKEWSPATRQRISSTRERYSKKLGHYSVSFSER